MFSLIITIISIALIAALALASIYYGGTAFTQGGAKANASAIVNQAMQISAAQTIHAADNGGTYASDVATLVSENYLASEPSLPNVLASGWTTAGTSATAVVSAGEVCDAVNDNMGVSTRPTFDGSQDPVSSVITGQYGCAEDTDAEELVFHFK
ncbi:hypothetical protein [Thioalkalivibrio thiocyanodenitrificans]|uniref:hypothetical protein n=1 Tax=Thioalkalivibrio thiocyanodenitrificans TaxID=243063 RepID=UPI000378E57E|nr:hypothetical protein [Thioalkalivibrio thiocyanodenitrificans]